MNDTLKRLFAKLGPFLGLILVISLFSLPAEMREVFPTYGNFRFVFIQTVIVAIGALGMTLIIVSGGIDLSVGSSIALTSVVGAQLIQRGYGPVAVLAFSILSGGTIGLLNGTAIAGLRMIPFIITLGGMAILRGIAFVATRGQSVGGFPASFRDLVRMEIGDGLSFIPLATMVIVTVVGWIFLSRLAAGRRVYAIGGNELAARFSGIRVERVKLGVYVISGLTAGIAALMALGYYGSASSGDASGYELNVIAAAVVGGASLTGGRGSALGVVLGALILQMISSGIDILGIEQSYSQIIIGSVVIAAVVLDNFNTWLAKRRLTAKAH